MEKRWFYASLLVLALCVPLVAQTATGDPVLPYRSRVSLWGGYTAVNMNDVNNTLNAAAGGGSVTKITGGYDIAGDFLYEVAHRLYVGARIGYVGTNQGKSSTITGESKQDLYLVPLMTGGRYYFRNADRPFNFSLGAFAGIGLGYGATKAGGTETKYSGSCFAGEVLLGGEYQLSDPVSVGLDVGYRYAPLSSMSTYSGGGTAGGGGGGGSGGGGGDGYAQKRAPIRNVSGGSLAFDFGGMFVNLGINFRY